MNLYRCEQCGLELAADELATVNGHAVPDVDDDGEVCGQTLCGPVRLNDEIAAARITELEAALAASQAECERLQKALGGANPIYEDNRKDMPQPPNPCPEPLQIAPGVYVPNKHGQRQF